MIETAIRYAEQHEPQFRKTIRGATSDQIQRLTTLVGGPLPRQYTEFLLSMGQESGMFDLTYGGTTRIQDIIDYYEEPLEPGEAEYMERYVIVGLGPPSLEMLLLHRSEEPNSVHFGDFPGVNPPVAASLSNLLCHRVFTRFSVAPLQHGALLVTGDDCSLISVSEALRAKGFQELAFSDGSCLCVSREDTAIQVRDRRATGGTGLGFHIGSKDDSTVNKLLHDLSRTFGVRQDQRW